MSGPLLHVPECNCTFCHLDHTHDGDRFIQNVKDFPQDFKCCVEEFDLMVAEFKICPEHPFSYTETAKDGNNKLVGIYCEECKSKSKSSNERI